MSVESTTTGRVSTTGSGMPVSTSAFTCGVWVKINSYATQFTQVFAWFDAAADNNFGADTGETTGPPGTTLDGFTFKNPTFDPHALLTSSYTGWTFIAWSYSGSGSSYKFRLRKEGITTLTTTTTSPGAALALLLTLSLFSDGSASGNTRLRSFFAQQVEMSDADLLTASQSLSAPAGTNLTFLALSSSATAGTQSGGATGANWTITGSLTTQAGDDPDPTSGFGGGFVPRQNYMAPILTQ